MMHQVMAEGIHDTEHDESNAGYAGGEDGEEGDKAEGFGDVGVLVVFVFASIVGVAGIICVGIGNYMVTIKITSTSMEARMRSLEQSKPRLITHNMHRRNSNHKTHGGNGGPDQEQRFQFKRCNIRDEPIIPSQLLVSLSQTTTPPPL